jgi:hypothetical protein
VEGDEVWRSPELRIAAVPGTFTEKVAAEAVVGIDNQGLGPLTAESVALLWGSHADVACAGPVTRVGCG